MTQIIAYSVIIVWLSLLYLLRNSNIATVLSLLDGVEGGEIPGKKTPGQGLCNNISGNLCVLPFLFLFPISTQAEKHY